MDALQKQFIYREKMQMYMLSCLIESLDITLIWSLHMFGHWFDITFGHYILDITFAPCFTICSLFSGLNSAKSCEMTCCAIGLYKK